MILLAAVSCLAAAPASAQTWSGFLVTADCYAALERNADPWDTSIYVDRDKDFEVRYCSPNTKTKTFTLVDHDGLSYNLDSAGNAKAAEIVRQFGNKKLLEVTVTGEKNKGEIKVSSISQHR
jgi:hypothetical protein